MFELYPEQRAEGEILLDGDSILTNSRDIALLRAKVGMVFQKPTVPNVHLRQHRFWRASVEKLSRADMDERVQWALTKAALWNETKDKLHQSGYSLWWSATAFVYCAWYRHSPGDAARRTVFGTRPYLWAY